MKNIYTIMELTPVFVFERQPCSACGQNLTQGFVISVQVEDIFKFYSDKGYWCANLSCERHINIPEYVWKQF